MSQPSKDEKELLKAASYVHTRLAAMDMEELSATYLTAYAKVKKVTFSLNGESIPSQDVSKIVLPIVLWHAWGVHCYINNKPRTDLIDHSAEQIRMVQPAITRSDLFLYLSEAICDMNEALGHNNIIELAPLHSQIMAIKTANKARAPAPSPN